MSVLLIWLVDGGVVSADGREPCSGMDVVAGKPL